MKKMSARIIVFVGIVIFLSGCGAPDEDVVMSRSDAKRSGVYDTTRVDCDLEVRWQFKAGNEILSSPVIYGDTVYFGSGDRYLYALDRNNGAGKWRFETDGEVYSSPAVAYGMVYFSSGDGNFYALDTETGEERWRLDFGEGEIPNPSLTSPIVKDGVVYFTGNGYLYAVETEDGEVKWEFYAGTRVENFVLPILSSPAIDDGVIYFGGSDGTFYALDTRSGKKKWGYKNEVKGYPVPILSSPTVGDGIVYFWSLDGFFYALDSRTGEEKWKFETGLDVFFFFLITPSPAVTTDTIYYPNINGSIYALDPETGEEKWDIKADSEILTSISVVDGALYFVTVKGTFYSVDAETGDVNCSLELELDEYELVAYSSPVVSDGVCYFGDMSGNFYAIGQFGAHPPPPPPEEVKDASEDWVIESRLTAFKKFQIEARKYEAAIILGGIYDAEVTYYLEKNGYSDDFEKIGFEHTAAPIYYSDYEVIYADKGHFVARAWGNIDDDEYLDIWQVTDLDRAPLNIADDITNEGDGQDPLDLSWGLPEEIADEMK